MFYTKKKREPVVCWICRPGLLSHVMPFRQCALKAGKQYLSWKGFHRLPACYRGGLPEDFQRVSHVPAVTIIMTGCSRGRVKKKERKGGSCGDHWAVALCCVLRSSLSQAFCHANLLSLLFKTLVASVGVCVWVGECGCVYVYVYVREGEWRKRTRTTDRIHADCMWTNQ